VQGHKFKPNTTKKKKEKSVSKQSLKYKEEKKPDL
jgi:hypothetical protein